MSDQVLPKTVSGSAVAAYIGDVARLRIAVFYEFPYLYDGSTEYEQRYLQKFIDCDESVLLSDYRGRGLGWRFFDEREAHAERLGGFAFSCFCAVERPDDHALRPSGYKSLENLWHRRGYPRQDLRTRFAWKDIDQAEESDKSMVYWMKRLTE